MNNYFTKISTPNNLIKSLINLTCPGQAGDVTKFLSTTAHAGSTLI